MKGDFEGVINLALDLELFKVLNALSRGLNLTRSFEWREWKVCETQYLDCDCANCGNDIQRPPKHAVVW